MYFASYNVTFFFRVFWTGLLRSSPRSYSLLMLSATMARLMTTCRSCQKLWLACQTWRKLSFTHSVVQITLTQAPCQTGEYIKLIIQGIKHFERVNGYT